MAVIPGYGGLFKTGSNTITTVMDWELDIKSEMYDTTTIQNSRAKTFLPGLYEWDGTLKMNWDASDTNGLVLLQTQVLAGSPSVQAVTLSTNNGTNNYTGNIWIKDLKVHDAVNKQVEVDISFQGTSTLSYA